MPTIHFVAGLPRSGSTLLQNILGQNPNHHVTPTSGLLWMMSSLREGWTNNDAFRAEGIAKVAHRIPSALEGMAYGHYKKELAEGRIVFDKNRGWVSNVELLEECFQRQVPVIIPIRDVKAILASFEKLYRANPVSRRQFLGQAFYAQAQTTDGRARILASPGGLVGLAINSVRDALGRGIGNRLLMVPYNRLVRNPQAVLSSVHAALGLDPYTYDMENIQQITHEDDSVHGWGPDLHKIRPRVEAPLQLPWEGVLSPETCRWIDTEFSDINQMAVGTTPPG